MGEVPCRSGSGTSLPSSGRQYTPSLRGGIDRRAGVGWRAFVVGLEAIQTLLRHGANVNPANKDGDTPLHVVARHHSWPDGAEALLEAGANPNSFNNAGAAPLHVTIRFPGNRSAIGALLDGGADPDAVDAGEMTALLLLIQVGEDNRVDKVA